MLYLPEPDKEWSDCVVTDFPLIVNIFDDINWPIHEITDLVAWRRTVYFPLQQIFHLITEDFLKYQTAMNESNGMRKAYCHKHLLKCHWNVYLDNCILNLGISTTF